MQLSTAVSNGHGLESIVREYWNQKNGFVDYLAFGMGVWNEREDLAQEFWMHAVEKKEEVENSESVSSLLNTMAAHEVVDFASRGKLRVHVSFEEGVDVQAILTGLKLEKPFKLLKKVQDPLGLPLYSGEIWPSRVEDIQNHPNRVYFAIKNDRRRTLVDPDTLPDQTRPVDDFEVSDEAGQDHRYWPLSAVLDAIAKRYPVQAWVLVLRIGHEVPWSKIAQYAGTYVKKCKKYYAEVTEVIRTEYPHLRQLLAAD